MGQITSMVGFDQPSEAKCKRKTIEEAIESVSTDLRHGIISESLAFDILCSELATITGLPVEAKRHGLSH